MTIDPSQNTERQQASKPSTPPSYLDMTRSVWVWIRWTGEITYNALDFAGEVLADFLGLTQSKYQWMIDMQQREEEDKRQRRLEARQRRQLRLEQLLEEEKSKLHALETGAENVALSL